MKVELISPITVMSELYCSHQGHYCLRLDRPVLNAINNFPFHLRWGFAGGRHQASVRDRYKPFGINRLIGKSDEVARPHAGLSRDEKTAGCRLKDGGTYNVTDPERDLRRRPMIAKSGRKATRSKLLQDVYHLRGELDEPEGRTIPGLPVPHDKGIGTRCGQKITAATCAHERASLTPQKAKLPVVPATCTPPAPTRP